MNDNKRIVEIKGVKMEVDFSEAQKIENYKIGDKVKLLKKKYSDEWKVYPGIIVSFDAFELLPTITIAYLEMYYNEANIKFEYYNEASKDTEIAYGGNFEIPFEASDVISNFEKQIETLKKQVEETEQKKRYFESSFKAYFTDLMNKMDS